MRRAAVPRPQGLGKMSGSVSKLGGVGGTGVRGGDVGVIREFLVFESWQLGGGHAGPDHPSYMQFSQAALFSPSTPLLALLLPLVLLLPLADIVAEVAVLSTTPMPQTDW